jgi:capsular exopolysaccharide synthesis family protein
VSTGLVEPSIDSLGISDERLVSLLMPRSYEAEQYRALRHLVEQAHGAAGISVIAVSSPGVGEGKTTTAINLAGAFAQSLDGRVLLIDADLRRPAVGHRLGATHEPPGLVDAILDRDLTLAAVAQPYSSFNLSVVGAGRFSGTTYEVLHSPRLGELLNEARQRYDYVVVDTPPLIPIPDARIIGKWVDGFLLVVRANKTPRKLVEESLNLMLPDKTIGLVFNNAERAPGRHHYYYSPSVGTPARRRRSAAWRRLMAKLGAGRAGGQTSWR